MERKKYLIITAGGSGTRMGSSVPKQFLTIGGKAILHLSIERFVNAVPGIKVITVLPEAHIDYWKKYCYSRSFIYPQTLVPGGITRFHSVKNGLERVPDGAVVAIHDGVRPLVSEDLIRNMFNMAESEPAVIPVLPVTDTLKALKKVENADGNIRLERMEGVVADRSLLYAAQTPQVFHSEILKNSYRQAFDTAFTDDASVAERKNIPLAYVDGERYNIKITTQADLVLAQAILSI